MLVLTELRSLNTNLPLKFVGKKHLLAAEDRFQPLCMKECALVDTDFGHVQSNKNKKYMLGELYRPAKQEVKNTNQMLNNKKRKIIVVGDSHT